MENLAKAAGKRLLEEQLKPGLEEEYKRLLAGIGHVPISARTSEDDKRNEIDETLTGDYAEEILLNLIQYMANGITELNALIVEDFHNPNVLFGSYEENFAKIRALHTQYLDLQSEIDPRMNIFDAFKTEWEAKQKAENAIRQAKRAERDANEAKTLFERTTKSVHLAEEGQRNLLEKTREEIINTKIARQQQIATRLKYEKAELELEESENQARKEADLTHSFMKNAREQINNSLRADAEAYEAKQKSLLAKFQASRLEKEALLAKEKAARLKSVSDQEIEEVFMSAREDHEKELMNIEKEYLQALESLEARRERLESYKQERHENEEDFVARQEKREAELVEIESKLRAAKQRREERIQAIEESRQQRLGRELEDAEAVEELFVDFETPQPKNAIEDNGTKDSVVERGNEIEDVQEPRKFLGMKIKRQALNKQQKLTHKEKKRIEKANRREESKKAKLAKEEAVRAIKEKKSRIKQGLDSVDYFDYLEDHQIVFKSLTGINRLEEYLDELRMDLQEKPRQSAFEAGRIAELALKGWLVQEGHPADGTFHQHIELATKSKMISFSLKRKLTAIRKKRNEGAHSNKPVTVNEARDTLIKLDEFLRYYAHKKIDSTILPTVKIKSLMEITNNDLLSELASKASNEELTSNVNGYESPRIENEEIADSIDEISTEYDKSMEQFEKIQETLETAVEKGKEHVLTEIDSEQGDAS